MVVDLDAVADASVASLGGKGANLARLVRAGFTVPPGFVISADAFRTFLACTAIGPVFLSSEQEESEDLLSYLEGTGWSRQYTFEKLQETLVESPMPEALVTEIREAYRRLGYGKVAVRSSALDEDSQAASFAGQYDTFLNVEGEQEVLRAVQRCWASLCSFRSYVYRKRAKLRSGDLRIAVVVQRMVPAEAAGVLFTTNPIGGAHSQMLLESSWGLGEGIVNGQVATDSFVVDKHSLQIVSKLIRYKLHRSAGEDGGGTSLDLVPAQMRERASLSDDRVVELAKLAVRAREVFGGEQDIEWAMSGGQLYLLQIRPVTASFTGPSGTINPDPEETNPDIVANTMWSMMDAGEATVGIMTPMSQGFMKYYRDVLHPRCLRASGIWDTSNIRPALGYIYGRCYLNVSHWASSFTQAPPFGDPTPLLRRFASEEIDFASYRTPYPSGVQGLKRLWCSVYWFSQQWRLATYRQAQKKAISRRFQTYDEVVHKDLTKLSMEELNAEIKRREEILVEASINYFPFYFLAFGSFEALTNLCKMWLSGTGIEQRLKADISGLRTVDVTANLWQVAKEAKKRPAIERVLRETPPGGVKRALLASDEGRAFWNEIIVPLLRNHGVRGQPPEMEFMNPRWVDNPSLLFSMARNYLENDLDIEAKLAAGERERNELTEKTLSSLPLPKRVALRTAIAAYYAFGQTREINRMWAMTETWALQRLVMEVGRRMVEKGILRSQEEMAFVDFRDYLAYAAGQKRAEAFPREMIEANRRAHLFNQRVPDPPLTIVGPYDPSKRLVSDEKVSTLTGVGTSPGRAVGKARVVVDVTTQAPEFRPGEVLVAHFTNATWTPLFVTAAAVVVDLGSILAHSSVVAREYGIPCVANVLDATRMIKTGDTVIVDGDAGKVWIERDVRPEAVVQP